MIVEERKTRRPALMFYPNDWQKDHNLQACSLEARGLWLELICIMHFGVPYGYLTDSQGAPLTYDFLARKVGVTLKKFRFLIDELLSKCAASCDERGVIFSRRMVRDESKRLIQSDFGKRGGNPRLKAPLEKESPYSIAVSSSPPPPPNPPEGGERVVRVFQKPTVVDVEAYCNERRNGIKAQEFFDYYEARGWMIGKNKMKDWRAAVRTWENRRTGERQESVVNQPRQRHYPTAQEIMEAERRWEEKKAAQNGAR